VAVYLAAKVEPHESCVECRDYGSGLSSAGGDVELDIARARLGCVCNNGFGRLLVDSGALSVSLCECPRQSYSFRDRDVINIRNTKGDANGSRSSQAHSLLCRNFVRRCETLVDADGHICRAVSDIASDLALRDTTSGRVVEGGRDSVRRIAEMEWVVREVRWVDHNSEATAPVLLRHCFNGLLQG